MQNPKSGETKERDAATVPLFAGKKEYLWVMLLNLEMNNKETELICGMKGRQIIPVEQIELEYKC